MIQTPEIPALLPAYTPLYLLLLLRVHLSTSVRDIAELAARSLQPLSLLQGVFGYLGIVGRPETHQNQVRIDIDEQLEQGHTIHFVLFKSLTTRCSCLYGPSKISAVTVWQK